MPPPRARPHKTLTMTSWADGDRSRSPLPLLPPRMAVSRLESRKPLRLLPLPGIYFMSIGSDNMRLILDSCRDDIDHAISQIESVHEGATMLRVSMRAPGSNGPSFIVECDSGCHGFALTPMTLDEIRWRK